ARQLVKEGKKEKAEKILDLAMNNFPIEYYIPFNNQVKYYFTEPYIDLYYQVGNKKNAADIAMKLYIKTEENLNFYKGMDFAEQQQYGYEIIDNFNTAYRIIDNCENHKDTATVAALNNRIAPFEKYFARYLKAYEQQRKE